MRVIAPSAGVKMLLRDNNFLELVNQLQAAREDVTRIVANSQQANVDWMRGRLALIIEILDAINTSKEMR